MWEDLKNACTQTENITRVLTVFKLERELVAGGVGLTRAPSVAGQ